VRDTIGTAVYFMTYESGKQMLATYGGGSPTSPLAVVTAGGLCGIVSWACVSYHIDETFVATAV
jgi:solute carrier family 25 (mitochondrial carnitine/acylcarnitine transporter), member 20/29